MVLIEKAKTVSHVREINHSAVARFITNPCRQKINFQ